MKFHRLFICLIALAAIAVSCKEKEEDLGMPAISTDPTTLSFDQEGGAANAQSVYVTSTRDWNATCDADWVTVSPASGSASSDAVEVSVYVDENTSTNRTAKITFDTGLVSATVTVSQEGPEGESHGDGSADNPYTVADVLALYDAGTAADAGAIYVKGIVSQIGTLNDTYGELTYYISDDGTTTNQLEIYQGYGFDGEKIYSTDYLSLGDEVIVYGTLTTYNGTNEMQYGSIIYSLNGTAIELPDYDNVDLTDPYTSNIGWTAGDSHAEVNDVVIINSTNYTAVKLGTGSYSSSAYCTLPAGTQSFVFWAVAWNNKSGAAYTATLGDDIVGSYTGNANSGIANSSPFTIAADELSSATDYHVINFDSALAEDTKFTIATTDDSNGRIVFFGTKYFDTPQEEPVDPSTVETTGSGTVDDPYTVADAYALYEAGALSSLSSVYVSGKISSLGTFSNPQYTYYITDAETTDGEATTFSDDAAKQIEVILGYGIGGENITVEDYIAVDDEVIVYGRLSADSDGNVVFDEGAAQIYSLNGSTDKKTPIEVPETLVYGNDFDVSQASSGNPAVTSTDIFKNELGSGIDNVEYDATSLVTVRSSSGSSGYDGASGVNNIFFGKVDTENQWFKIKNIALPDDQSNYELTFGGYDSGDNFDHSTFKVYISNDGEKWVQISYTFANGDQKSTWDLATSNFTLPSSTSTLYLYFEADAASVYRLDDVALNYTSTSGTSINFDDGVSVPEGQETVDPDDVETTGSGTSDDPYTVADTWILYNAGVSLSGLGTVYVKGIVQEIGSVFSNTLTYYISDDGTSTDRIEIYDGKGLDGENITSTDYLTVGDELVVCGTLSYYSNYSIIEFSSGSSIYSRTAASGYLNLSATEITVQADAGSTTFEITSDQSWTVSSDNADFTVSPASGEGNATVTVSYSENEGSERTATITVTSDAGSKTVSITQNEPVQVSETLVYGNDFDKDVVSSNTTIKNSTTCYQNESGSGISNVSYAYSDNMSIRVSSASSGYDGASGNNNVFFGTDDPDYFIIENITLPTDETNYELTFGACENAAFSTDNFKVYISEDGEKYVRIEYSFADGTPTSSNTWGLASSSFTVPSGTSTLYIYFEGDVTSAYHIDDVALNYTSTSGTTINFDDGVTVPEESEVEQNEAYVANVTWTIDSGSGDKADKVSIGGVTYENVLKLGASGKVGKGYCTLPSGTKSFSFYCLGWSGVTSSPFTVSLSDDSFTSQEFTANGNTGVTGSSPFTIDESSLVESDYHTIEFDSALTDETTLYIETTSTSYPRIIVFGARYATSSDD